jgi:hypothetical protein
MRRLLISARWLWRATVWMLLIGWLCLISLVLTAWAFSYRSGMSIERTHRYSLVSQSGENYQMLACGGGRFEFYWSWQHDRYGVTQMILRSFQKSSNDVRLLRQFKKAEPLKLPPVDYQNSQDEPLWRQLGFGWYYEPNGPYEYKHHGVLAPGWAVAGALAIPWILIVHARRKRRTIRLRRQRGLCIKCGYDLRASSGRCPECGAVIAANIPAAAT